MHLWEEYHLAYSVADALDALRNSPGPARLIAGGTDLLLDLQQGRQKSVHTLVDISDIPELTALEIRGESLYIGAAVPLNRLVASQLVREHAEALHEAAGLIGGPQVRNTATLGGNVAHALPAGDGTIALLALDAQAVIESLEGTRLALLEDLFIGPGRSSLKKQEEILVGFSISLRDNRQGSAFQRVMRPQGVAIAILNMAVWLESEVELITDLRIAIGPSGLTPRRARTAEASLIGHRLDEKGMKRALVSLLEESHFRTSPHRATHAYRQQMAGILLEQVLSEAWRRSLPEV